MKTIATLLVFVLALQCYAQQLPLFSQYREFSGIVNPAAVPTDYLWYQMPLSFGASTRWQWITDKDGPKTQMLRADYFFKSNVSMLAGGYIIHDQAGRVGMTGVYGRFAGVLSRNQPDEEGLVFGLSLGLVRYGLDLSNAQLTDPSDINIYEADNKIFPDASIGVFGYTTFYNDNMLYGGVSVPQVLGLNLNFRDENYDLNVQRQRHYFATVGYKIELPRDYTFLEISSWAKFIPPLAPHADLNVRYQMHEKFGIGAGMSTAGYAHLEFGLKLGDERIFRLGYGYDAPFTATSTYFGSSHEINLTIAFDRKNSRRW